MAKFRGDGESRRPNVLHLGARPPAPGRWRDAALHLSPGNAAAPCESGGDTQDARRLAAIVEGSDDAIIGKTLDGTITSWNSGATRIFGYTAAEMIGASISRIVPPEISDEEVEIIAKLTRGERIDYFETVRLTQDGHHVPVSLAVSPIRDAAGKIIGASKIARDISDRKAAEKALRDANAQAQHMRVEADSANSAKTDFLAAMSHEIRTPLNCIEGVVYLLTKTNGLTSEQRRYADLVKNASMALRAIVDDILDFSKVEAGLLGLEQRPFDLSTLIHDTIAIVEPSAHAKNLELTCVLDARAPRWVSGDQGRLRQIILNLLSNAVKFTTEGSVKLEARSQIAADGRQQAFFCVTDTGLGIPVELQHRLFRPFSQADNSMNRLHGGTGLGLSICRRLVDMMDGEIDFASQAGQGTTIWFTASLPSVSEPEQESTGKTPLEVAAERPCRILVVDDIETNLEIVETVLHDAGHDVVSVNSGVEAIRELTGSPFDLVFMDVQMPSMDGVTAARCIRALPAPTRDTPIIAMTAHVLPQQVKSFLDAGMNDHIGKPIDFAKLRDMVRRWQPRADQDGVLLEPGSYDFDSSSYDAFVLAVGENSTRRVAHMFLESLSGAFKSTFAESQREAHGLINTAGVLGLSGLVRACRQIACLTSSQEPERVGKVLQDLQREQLIARQMLTQQILPKLHAGPVAPHSAVAEAVRRGA